MGADGGMCWIKLRNPTKYNRVCELIKPFYFLTYVDDYHESNIDWESGGIYSPEYLVGTYGTDQEFSIHDDLVEVLEDNFDEVISGMDPTPTYGQLTFLELVEDLKTRPFTDNNQISYFYLTEKSYSSYKMRDFIDPNGRRISKLEIMLWGIIKYSKPEELREDLGILADIKVNDWLNELRSLLEPNSFGSEETWT